MSNDARPNKWLLAVLDDRDRVSTTPMRFCSVFQVVLTVCAGMPVFAAPAYVRTEQQGSRWLIGNDFVERIVSFSDTNGLRTESLVRKSSGTDFTAYGRHRNEFGQEFSFSANGNHLDGHRSFRFGDAESIPLQGGRALRIVLHDGRGMLDVTVYYAVFDHYPAIRKWIAITNKSSSPITLTHLCFEALSIGAGTPGELELSAGYGAAPQPLFFTGRASDVGLFLRNSKTGEGVSIFNEAPGYLKRTEVGQGWREGLNVMYDTDLFPFERSLQPGETFQSAKSSLVFFQDNHGFDDPRWAVPGYMSDVIMRRKGAYKPVWLYNTWEPFLRGIDERTVGELVPIAARMGTDVFTIDDGWQREYGANDDNKANFPDGVSGVAKLLSGKGLGLGLWVPLAAVSVNTTEYRQHPEWACRDREGHPKFTQTASGTQAVMCLGSGYRDAALKRLDDLVERYHPRYLKIDLTTVFNAYGEEPGCNAPGHRHKSWAESLDRIYEGLEYIGEHFHRTHPEVLVDYTFELWGEKHLIDAALLGCADLDWLSNVSDANAGEAGPVQARTLLYQRALSIPVETMLIGNLRASTSPVEERLGVSMGSGPMLLGDLRKLTGSEQAWYGKWIRWYKQFRNRVALSDSFFPQGSWQQPGQGRWDGFARLSRESDGLIVLFRNGSSVSTAEVKAVAPPGARYDALSILNGRKLGEVSATDLTAGWMAPFDTSRAVTILELKRRP
ncbi:MAG TPA: alpha-galactosidase [Bryobacteraceae bacterium]|nr:alpha-galactosidase [Bryobacteraceae bacterium]